MIFQSETSNTVRAVRVFATGASELPQEHVSFTEDLGARLMTETPFILVTGGLKSKKGSTHRAFDGVIAEAALKALGGSIEAAQSRIITLLPETDHSKLERFEIGTVIRASYAGPRTRRYSMVLTSDAIIAVNGATATTEVIDLAFISGKPLVLVPATGGSAAEAWNTYGGDLRKRFQLTAVEVDSLCGDDQSIRATTCLELLNRFLRPRCFVAMPFSGHPLANVFETIRSVAEDQGYRAIRVDQEAFIGSIVEAIWDSIRHSDLVIADLTNHRPNVYYEMGISHALGKPTLLTIFSRDGTVPDDVPFDIKVQRVVPYGTIESLQMQLRSLLPDALPHRRPTENR